jgi:hypothetical protein
MLCDSDHRSQYSLLYIKCENVVRHPSRLPHKLSIYQNSNQQPATIYILPGTMKIPGTPSFQEFTSLPNNIILFCNSARNDL